MEVINNTYQRFTFFKGNQLFEESSLFGTPGLEVSVQPGTSTPHLPTVQFSVYVPVSLCEAATPARSFFYATGT
ncbi:hypothetical protein J6590_077885 [Homalodisca vitripennis]|nr:hypothetical protein J6590_077885 [Homalodisca vitripennis]